VYFSPKHPNLIEINLMTHKKSWLKKFLSNPFNYEDLVVNRNGYLAYALISLPILIVIICSYYIVFLEIMDSLDNFDFIILLSSSIAFAGLLLTSFSLLVNSIETRRKSSMDILFSLEKDLDFSKSKKAIMYALNLEDIILENPVEGIDADYNNIINLKHYFTHSMNIYEFLALSIRQGIIDEELFKSLYRSRFLKVWQQTVPAINKIRDAEDNPELYEHIEWLAERCKNY
tara:strand:+ start:23008 stop:23700 length:693 start_codon:yes stop_codon:yes gene_type:complete